MKRTVLAVLTAGTLIAGGCGGPSGPAPIKLGGTDSAEVRNAQQAMKTKSDDSPVPPADAQWTIVCTQFKGTGHVEQAKVYKQMIAAKTGWKGFYCVHEDESSTLYYGFYASISPRGEGAADGERDHAASEGKHAQEDLARIRSLENNVGDPLFGHAVMQPLEPADPAAPPQWNLSNIDRLKSPTDPTRAFYTLEIAVYKDNPLRKQGAVDSVKALREMGVKNAYFYHGKTASSVCIGTWPESAVSIEQPERGAADDRLLVAPPGMPSEMAAGLKDETGHRVRTVQLKVVPIDPTLIDTMSKYDRRSVNGYDIEHTYNTKDGGTVKMYDPSLLVPIPRDETSGLVSNDQASDGSPPVISQPPQTSGSRLRSLGGGQ